MARYSDEIREQMVRKMMPPHNRSVASIHRETGISAPTLYAWKRQFQEQGYVIAKKATTPEGWDGKARLAALIKTASMNEVERSTWCREHGVYPEQLDDWKAEFEALGSRPANPRELAVERNKRRKLEKELRRKEKALAEAAALLTLSKKAQAIWGTDEED